MLCVPARREGRTGESRRDLADVGIGFSKKEVVHPRLDTSRGSSPGLGRVLFARGAASGQQKDAGEAGARDHAGPSACSLEEYARCRTLFAAPATVTIPGGASSHSSSFSALEQCVSRCMHYHV